MGTLYVRGARYLQLGGHHVPEVVEARHSFRRTRSDKQQMQVRDALLRASPTQINMVQCY